MKRQSYMFPGHTTLLKNILLLVFCVIGVCACKKQATIETAEVQEYMPVYVGKYIRYQLDSLRFVDFGQRDTIVSYDAKDIVEAEITDNAGRPTFRIVRYLRDVNSNDEADYQPTLTYFVTASRESVELSENNLRFQKLRLPVTNGFNWHGNSYLPVTPYYSLYEFSNDEDIHDWDYTYENVNGSVEVGDNVYDSTVTVLQVADSSNVPIEFPEGLAYKNYWQEIYAKNIGLIYREVEMWEYQPPYQNSPGYRSGFGIRMTIIEHN